MQNILFTLVFITAALTLSGCATSAKMAFQKDTDTVTTTTGSVFLMTTTLKNNYRTFFQPRAKIVTIERIREDQKSDQLKLFIDNKGSNDESSLRNWETPISLRMELEKGNYEA